MNGYQKRKNAAREKAIEWQHDFENHNYSYGELAAWGDYFAKLGKRYGLTEEFTDTSKVTYKMQTRVTLDKKKLEEDLGSLAEYEKVTQYNVLRIS